MHGNARTYLQPACKVPFVDLLWLFIVIDDEELSMAESGLGCWGLAVLHEELPILSQTCFIKASLI